MFAYRCIGLFAKNMIAVHGAGISSVRALSTTKMRNKFLSTSPNAYLDKSVLNRYRALKYDPSKIQATYIWIDGTGEHIRLKDRILTRKPERVEDLPLWQYDGSSTYQALGGNSDTTLVPRAIYRDPFKVGEQDVIVVCDTYKPDGNPTESNHRHLMQNAVDKTIEHEPWFGIEQEYTLLDMDERPFGWPKNGYPAPQGPYYCGVGANRVYARDLAEAHALACLYAGIDFAGTNSEVMPAQWEYQVGPSLGMKAADDLWVSRYILSRIAEELGIVVTFHPKPIKGNWNGAGAHTNFSTKNMRADGGMEAIKAAIEKLSKQHEKHIKAYDPQGGAYNIERLTGALETSSIDKFSWGIADRGTSVRVSRSVANAGKGYLEDRRPSSNCDPYAVCNAILTTTLID
uniref:Glutamine synthetase n=1 Tax=Mayetiola destructor TaxID=39758 RepID=V5SKI8_MAYDE|nr:glutamine synthetase [Mayetiola destructor]